MFACSGVPGIWEFCLLLSNVWSIWWRVLLSLLYVSICLKIKVAGMPKYLNIFREITVEGVFQMIPSTIMKPKILIPSPGLSGSDARRILLQHHETSLWLLGQRYNGMFFRSLMGDREITVIWKRDKKGYWCVVHHVIVCFPIDVYSLRRKGTRISLWNSESVESATETLLFAYLHMFAPLKST